MSSEWGGFRFGADYLFGTAAKKSTDSATPDHKTANNGQGYNLGAFYKRKIGEFGFATEGGYGEIKQGTLETNEYTQKRYGAALELSYGPMALGFDWAGADQWLASENIKRADDDLKQASAGEILCRGVATDKISNVSVHGEISPSAMEREISSNGKDFALR